MRNLIIVALIAAAVWYWQKHGSTQEVMLDAAGNPAVVIYTVSQCEPCRAALGILDSRGVPYLEKEIDPQNESDADVKHWRSIGDNMLPVTLAGQSKVKGSSKWEMIGLLGTNFGDKYLTGDEQVYFRRHFDTSGSPLVVLYGTSWCPSCAALRKDLVENGVNFVDIDVEQSGEFDKLTKVMEIPGYPATWVGYTRVYGTTYNDVKAVINSRT
ncbi:MAG: hypothetical protein HZB95_11275 [Nitrosomonadales bacterium]|nr:hypothetical protein [Nitrosomonadales bacterium]